MEFNTLLERARKGNVVRPERLLCLDPGNMTGVAVFEHGELYEWRQIVNVEDNQCLYASMLELFKEINPDRVVCENYRLYQHKLEAQSFSEVTTVRIIGFIEAICQLGLHNGTPVPLDFQMANQAKGFCTDEKLRDWGYWQKGMKHSRDAIRHGCYWLLFNKEVV